MGPFFCLVGRDKYFVVLGGFLVFLLPVFKVMMMMMIVIIVIRIQTF